MDLIIFVIFAAIVGVTLAIYNQRQLHPQMQTKISIPIIQSSFILPTSVPTSTPTPIIPKPETASQVSPDGTKQLTMTITTHNDFSKTYLFITSDANGSNQHVVYETTNTASDSGTMSIPFNSWSPNDRYLFITKINNSGTEALVMRGDAQPITENESNFNVTEIFESRITGNIYQETTGWASDTLLIINTKTSDGSKGPSYWFEVPTKAIIQLSTQF